jgi:hypothetical protein
VVILLQKTRILSLFGNIFSDFIPLLGSEALMILFKYHEVVGLWVNEHLGRGVLEIQHLMSELLTQSLHRDDADGIARNGNDPLRTLFRAERASLL